MIDNTTQRDIVAGVVVLFNPNVIEFKKSLSTYLPFCDFLICVDNSDNTIENELNFKKIVYIPYGRNWGLAKALNDGCRVAIDKGASILITFDQDTFFETDCIPKLIDYVRKNQQSVASPNIKRIVRDSNGDIVVENQPFFQEETTEIPWCITSGCTFSSDVFITANGFDDSLFIGQIDQDFSCRVHSGGGTIVRLGDVFMHQEAGNVKKYVILGKSLYSPNLSPLRYYYIFRNEYYLRKKWKDEYKNCKVDLYKYIFYILFFEKNKYSKMKAILKGIKDCKKLVQKFRI